jgi:DNA repair exonuclease SbcCD ATPase subunit
VSGKILKTKGELKSIDQKCQDLAESRTEAESELSDIEDQLKSMGAVDPQRLAENQRKMQEASDAKKDLSNKLQFAWENALPLSLLGDLRTDLERQIEAEQAKRDWIDRRSAVEPQLPIIKEKVFDNVPKEYELPEDTFHFYNSRLDDALKSLFEPPPLGIERIDIFVTEIPRWHTPYETNSIMVFLNCKI